MPLAPPRGPEQNERAMIPDPSRPRRLAALLALVAAAALALAVAGFLVTTLRPLVVALLGTGAVLWGLVRALTSRGPARLVWSSVVVIGVALVGSALHAGGSDGLQRVLVLAVLAAVFGLLSRVALDEGGAAEEPRDAQPTVSPKRPVLLMNPWSGGGKVERFGLVEAANELGIEAVVLRDGDDLEQLARDAVARGADVLGMAGGDGSQALVAGIAAEHGLPLVVVPAGTRNHFALDLGLDREDPRGALAAFRGVERHIDLATVNGRTFVNNVSLGLYARVVQEPGYREEKSKTALALLPDLLGDRSEPFDLRFDGPGGKRYEGAQLLLVSNNPYELTGSGDLVGRTRLDRGVLGIAAMAVYDPPSLAKLAQLVRTAHLEDSEGWREWSCPEFRVDSGDEPVFAGVDGEALELAPPLEFALVPGGLRVLVPEGNGAAVPSRRTGFSRSGMRELWTLARGR
jgi:diacylglycerol kinase family enzyme